MSAPWAIGAATVAVLALLPGTAWASNDPDPVPPGTGCCFSFDHSPVTVVFCQVPNSCTITPEPKPRPVRGP